MDILGTRWLEALILMRPPIFIRVEWRFHVFHMKASCWWEECSNPLGVSMLQALRLGTVHNGTVCLSELFLLLVILHRLLVSIRREACYTCMALLIALR